ncbi:ribonuclease domain-containing protein [Streptomyces sp. ACA25]|uniref:ribonuclease domain-containing protein n=1 Tax=Streptomyces sp. ACA25 TaxID=3022596 RepID=UPI002306F064|nr:ribonuclease domain-containing protein [Streptomyces sp. ACA25]MDB1088400.1 ribonuclease domain-containing protein [Streptomyces sp. ACA25]
MLLAFLTGASLLLLAGCDLQGDSPRSAATGIPSANGTPSWAQGMETVTPGELPRQARETIDLITEGGPFPYDQDDTVFMNRERRLPQQDRGYYREYTVDTPGLSHRGARRIVTGDGGEFYYTEDHYDSFKAVVQR